MSTTIKSVQIENFQSHANSKIEFAPAGQLTVLVGPSDNGKTVVVRAVRWAACNEPRGTDFIRVGTNQSRITVVLADGGEVVRERSRKGFNRYILRKTGEKDQKFEGFGDGVPLEVQEVLGIRPVVTAGDQELNLNLAGQLEGPFLGSSVSAPARAKVLGKLAGAEEVDYAAKQLNTDLYHRRQEEKSSDAKIAGLKENLKKYKYLQSLGEAISRAAVILVAVKVAQERKNRLERLRSNLKEVDRQIKDCRTKVDNLTLFVMATDFLTREADKAITKHACLVSGKQKLSETEAGISAAQDILNKTSGIIEAYLIVQKTGTDTGTLARLKKLQTDYLLMDTGIQAASRVMNRTEKISETEYLADVARVNTKKLSRLQVLKNTLDSVVDGIRQNSKLILSLAQVIEAELIEKATNANQRKITRLRPLADSLKNIDTETKKCLDRIGTLSPLIERESLLTAADEAHHKLTLLGVKGRLDSTLDHNITVQKEAVQQHDKTIQTLQKEYGDVLAEAGICPTCGAEITKFKLKEVV